jgi:hypothetical protein
MKFHNYGWIVNRKHRRGQNGLFHFQSTAFGRHGGEVGASAPGNLLRGRLHNRAPDGDCSTSRSKLPFKSADPAAAENQLATIVDSLG